jgi:HTH-type transcriptional regulator/antitoxin HigA
MSREFDWSLIMKIKPIRTEADYEAALKEIEALFEAKANTAEGDRLEVLALLVEEYEKKHYSIPQPDPISAIKYYMESRGLTNAELEPYIGNSVEVAEVLGKKRFLSIEMIRSLHAELGILAETLIQPYALDVT